MDAERIRRQMQEVAVGNYSAFIAAADALQDIRGEVSSIDKHLDSLVSWCLTDDFEFDCVFVWFNLDKLLYTASNWTIM